MKFAVHISRRPERDTREVSQWISRKSRQGAIRWLDALEGVVDRLAEGADSYPLAKESRSLPFSVREILFRTPKGRRYRVIFAIEGSRVDVLSIRAPGQSPVTEADLKE